MPINLAKENANIGEIIHQWGVKEYEQTERDKRWFIVMGVLGTALILFALLTGNYLFILIVVLFGIILFLHGMQPPLEVGFAITQTGVVLGNKFYRYSEFDSFWLIYNPPEVKTLYFSFNNILRHRIHVPLLENDPNPIREHLIKFVDEDFDQEEEPLSDRVARLFRLY